MKGVSDIVGTVLLMGVAIAAISIVLVSSTGILDEIKERSLYDKAKDQMGIIDSSVRLVSEEGRGSSRLVYINDGEYNVNATSDTIRFAMETKSKIIPPGVARKEGNVLISTGADVKAYDNGEELVIENGRFVFAAMKIGSEFAPEKIDTASLIKRFGPGGKVKPKSSRLIVDDIETSSSGTGYTKIIQEGDMITKGTIVAHVKSTQVSYEIWYTLSSGADFVEIDVKNIERY